MECKHEYGNAWYCAGQSSFKFQYKPAYLDYVVCGYDEEGY